MQRDALQIDEEMLHRRIAVCYTGEPRNSGTNNWELTKRHIDGDRELFEIFDGIRDTSLAVRSALLDARWDDPAQFSAMPIPKENGFRPTSQHRKWTSY